MHVTCRHIWMKKYNADNAFHWKLIKSQKMYHFKVSNTEKKGPFQWLNVIAIHNVLWPIASRSQDTSSCKNIGVVSQGR